MTFAIIAAGEGSRLVEEGIGVPKPLLKVGGECLTDRLMRVFCENGATQVFAICNEQMTEVQNHFRCTRESCSSVHFDYMVKTTLSSMHSLWELGSWLGDAPFVLTTVDTVFREKEFAGYVRQFLQILESGEADGLMGVTEYIDDEKPLYVSTDGQNTITGFSDSCDSPRYISAGIYGLTPRSLVTLRHCVERGERRMRNFQRALVDEGFRLKAYPFSKVLDIDHAEDIRKAEELVRSDK